MKWLLQSPIGKNPGDDFIRLGVMNIVKVVDDKCEFLYVDKMEPEQYKSPIRFDKAIWCGGPLFWSKEGNQCHKINWWDRLLMGWISERRKDFLILGAGSFAEWPASNHGIFEPENLIAAARKLVDRSWAVYARDSIANDITGLSLSVLPCPAIFAAYGASSGGQRKLANIMPNGGHYRVFGPDEALIWDGLKYSLGRKLLDIGFDFVAHDKDEANLARFIGWDKSSILEYDGLNAIELAQAYATCSRYVGNRIHGAISARLNNAIAINIGYDSRQAAVGLVGGKPILPSGLDKLDIWDINCEFRPFDANGFFNTYVDIVRNFANA